VVGEVTFSQLHATDEGQPALEHIEAPFFSGRQIGRDHSVLPVTLRSENELRLSL